LACIVIYSFDVLNYTCNSQSEQISPRKSSTTHLVHLPNQSVDLVLSIAQVTTFDEMSEFSCSETSSWVAQLERPQEVGSLLEVGSDSEDLVNQVLHADNAVLAEVGLNDGVVGESNALLVNFSISSLVDELTNRLQVGVSVGDPWLDDLEHLKSGFGHANKDTIVDLEETKELEDLSGLWCDFIDSLDTDNEDQLLFSRDVEGTILLRQASKTDLLTLLITVLLHVLFGTLEDDTTLLLLGLLLLLKLGRALLSSLLLALALLQESLGDENLVGSWDASVSG